MDTVYGTKKYFQSLSGASDIYRTPACRAVVSIYGFNYFIFLFFKKILKTRNKNNQKKHAIYE